MDSYSICLNRVTCKHKGYITHYCYKSSPFFNFDKQLQHLQHTGKSPRVGSNIVVHTYSIETIFVKHFVKHICYQP